MASTARADEVDGPTLFGHPTGLFVLFFAEMWERFSYYGMRALLLYYMIKGFLGYTDEQAYAVYGAYGALVYAAPFFGGMLADRLLGARRAVIVGGLLMAAGHLLMTVEQSTPFFVALSLLVVGNGFFKPNISTIVGSLYPEGSSRRDAGFTVFYMGINLGAAMSPLLCGYVGETYGWHYGFGIATVGMLVGLAVFVAPVRIAQGLILGGAALTAGAMVMLPDNPYLLAVNALVAAALLVAGVLSFVALGRGGLAHDTGLPPDPSALKKPLLGPISAEWSVYLGTALAVPVIALLVQQNEITGWVLVVLGGVALASILYEAVRSPKIERERLFVVIVLMFFSMLFWSFFEQAGSSVNNFTDRNVDRVMETRTVEASEVGTTLQLQVTQEQLGHTRGDEVYTLDQLDDAREDEALDTTWPVSDDDVGMGVADPGAEIPGSTFQSANPIFILTFGLVFSTLWAFLGARGIEPSTPVKFSLGLIQLGLGFAALWYGAMNADAQGMVWVGWLLLGYLLHTTGELCLSPVGLSMVTKLSPRRMVSTVMGAWFLATGFSNYLAGLLAGLTGVSSHGESDAQVIPPPVETVGVYGELFQAIAGVAIASGLVLLALSPLLRRWMHEDVSEAERHPSPPAEPMGPVMDEPPSAPDAQPDEAAEVWVSVSARPGAPPPELEPLAGAILDAVRQFLSLYPTAGDDPLAGVTARVEGDKLVFVVPEGDHAHRVRAWIRVGLAGARDEVETAMSDAGVGWNAGRRSMAEALEGLDAIEDAVLHMLRPSDEHEQGIAKGLDEDDPEVRASTAWYLGNMARPSAATLRALAEAGADEHPRVTRAVRRALTRLGQDAELDTLVRELRTADNPRVRAAVLCAVEGLVDQGTVTIEEAHAWLLEGTLDDPPVPEVAAERVVRLAGAQDRAHVLVPALLQVLDARERLGPEAAHGAVLGLVNLHLQTRQIPQEVHDVLQREAQAPSDHQGLARWALDLFSVV